MALRTIMIFPHFDNIAVIDEIRQKYDPLCRLVKPHITLVFPFESDLPNEELQQHLEEKLRDIPPFPVRLHGFSCQEDRFGNYLFLNVEKGMEQLKGLHDILYSGKLKPFDIGAGYIPHITVGKLNSPEELYAAYKSVRNCDEIFETEVTVISVEMIGEHDESIIILEQPLI